MPIFKNTSQTWLPSRTVGPFAIDEVIPDHLVAVVECQAPHFVGSTNIRGKDVVRFDPSQLRYVAENASQPMSLQIMVHASYPQQQLGTPETTCTVIYANRYPRSSNDIAAGSNEAIRMETDWTEATEETEWLLISHFVPPVPKLPLGHVPGKHSRYQWKCKATTSGTRVVPSTLTMDATNYSRPSTTSNTTFLALQVHTSFPDDQPILPPDCDFFVLDDNRVITRGNDRFYSNILNSRAPWLRGGDIDIWKNYLALVLLLGPLVYCFAPPPSSSWIQVASLRRAVWKKTSTATSRIRSQQQHQLPSNQQKRSTKSNRRNHRNKGKHQTNNKAALSRDTSRTRNDTTIHNPKSTISLSDYLLVDNGNDSDSDGSGGDAPSDKNIKNNNNDNNSDQDEEPEKIEATNDSSDEWWMVVGKEPPIQANANDETTKDLTTIEQAPAPLVVVHSHQLPSPSSPCDENDDPKGIVVPTGECDIGKGETPLDAYEKVAAAVAAAAAAVPLSLPCEEIASARLTTVRKKDNHDTIVPTIDNATNASGLDKVEDPLNRCDRESSLKRNNNEESYEFVLFVDGMTCQGCERVVKNTLLGQVPDVVSVKVSWKDATASVLSNTPRLNLLNTVQGMEAVGFDVFMGPTPTPKMDAGESLNNNNSLFLESLSIPNQRPLPGFGPNRESSLSLMDDLRRTGSTPIRRYRCRCGSPQCICGKNPVPNSNDPGLEVSLGDLCRRLEQNLGGSFFGGAIGEQPHTSNRHSKVIGGKNGSAVGGTPTPATPNLEDWIHSSNGGDKDFREQLASMPIPCGCGRGYATETEPIDGCQHPVDSVAPSNI